MSAPLDDGEAQALPALDGVRPRRLERHEVELLRLYAIMSQHGRRELLRAAAEMTRPAAS